MSRLTNQNYLERREAVRADWLKDRALTFFHLGPLDEVQLHEYFAPTRDYNAEQALAHRTIVTESRPSLPQYAGRAYAQALQFLGKKPDPKSLPLQFEAVSRREVSKWSPHTRYGIPTTSTIYPKHSLR